ncbi:MAG: tetratricopeptide repeat protein, partial [Acidobacteriota bacterium]|nr:tetratricopeptide repeat protein [Acidobacteriota bacterium]
PAMNIAALLPAQSSLPPVSAFPPAPALVAGTSQIAGAAAMNVLPLAKFMPFVEGVARDPLSQGRALLELGLVEQAIAELSVAAIASPNLIEANNLLGLAYDRAGRHAEALASYERALSLAPGDAETLNNLGYSFYLNNQPQAALPLLKQAARRAPQNAGIAQNLALVYGRLGKYGDAYKTLKAVTSEYAARLQVAALLATAGRDRDAIKHLEAARRLQPAALVPLEQLALLYERAGRLAEAAEARQQFRTSPDNPSQKSVATKEN